MEKLFTSIKVVLAKLPTSLCFIVVLGLALGLRIPQLNSSFWLDEAAQALESSRPFSQQLQIRDDFQPPLIHLLVFFLLRVSDTEVWLRTGAALIPALITLYFLIQIGRKYFSETAGWVSGLLLATSSFHIFYSQELRPYSLPAMFALLSWWAMLKLSSKQHKNYKMELVIWGVWSALGLYSSYLYPFVFIGQLFFLAFSWRSSLKKLLAGTVATVITCATFIPWLPSFFLQLNAGQQLRQNFPGWQAVVSFDQYKSLALTVGKFLFGVLDLSINPFYITSLALALGLSTALIWSVRKNPIFRRFLPLFICWAVIPIVGAWLISFFVPILQPKRVLFALPAIYLAVGVLVAAGIDAKAKSSQLLAPSLFGVLLIVNLFGTCSYYTNTKYQRENWREVHNFISEKYSPKESVVLFAFSDQLASWKWYNRNDFPTASTGVLVVNDNPDSPERQRTKELTTYHYILVFDYLTPLTDPKHHIDEDLRHYGFEQVGFFQGNEQLGNIRVYARARQIIGYSEY